MNFLATDGNELYVTKKKDNNIYDWKPLHTIYHKEYSDRLTEIEIIPNKEIIYDIYILPVWNEKYSYYTSEGYQCLFSLSEISETSISFYLESSEFILHWESQTKKIFITDGTETTKLFFRIRDISTGEWSKEHKIFTGIDNVNKVLNTGIFDANKNILSIHPSYNTTKSNYVFQENDKTGPVSIYNLTLPENDSKLYLFTLQFALYKDEQKIERSYAPLFIQFTYANGKMENERVGPFRKFIGSRYLTEDLYLNNEFSIHYIPDETDPTKSYLKIISDYKISRISYNYLII